MHKRRCLHVYVGVCVCVCLCVRVRVRACVCVRATQYTRPWKETTAALPFNYGFLILQRSISAIRAELVGYILFLFFPQSLDLIVHSRWRDEER